MIQAVHRQRRKTLTDKMVAALTRKKKRYILADPELRGHYVRVPPQGPPVYVAVARSPFNKQVWATIGTAEVLGIGQARELARSAILRIKEGKAAFEPPAVEPDSVQAVAENWLRRHVEKNRLRTRHEIERVLAKYVLPFWGTRAFSELRRPDVAILLDHIEDAHGPRMADVTRTILGGIGSWFSERNENYNNPFLRHRARVPMGSGTRERILSDDELRAVWRACQESGTFGRFVQLLLLTAQRRGAVSTMRWNDISPDGVWTMPRGVREKSNAGLLKLPPLALEILRAQPRLAGNGFVFFQPIGKGALSSFDEGKKALDKRSGITGWTLHDARRTARSLMSRAGVSSEHAERVMGHVLGVEGVYARYTFDTEKAVALEKLAGLITRIVEGEQNVVPLHRAPTA